MNNNYKKETFVIAIDAGTQSIRAALINLKGEVCKIEKTEIEPYTSSEPGFAEQDADYLWNKLCETTQGLMKNISIPIKNIKGISITTQRGSVVNLDRDGKPLRPAIIWLDQRKAKLDRFPTGMIKKGLLMINLYGSITHAIKDGESNWLKQNQPEIWNKTYKYLFLSGYFNYKLTGKYIDSIGSTVGYMPFNYKKQQWCKPGEFNSKMFPISSSKLAELVKPSELLGHISKQAMKETGLPEGLPVIAAAADKACEVLGSGCMTPDIACLSFGTTATVETVHPKYREVIRFFPSYPSAIPNHFNTEFMIYRGYWMINWFKNEFGYREIEKSKETGIPAERQFDEMIKDIPPGSMGLTLQPYWSPGIRIPGVEAKGAIIGFGDVHTRAHIYKAILEGLTYSLKQGARRTEKKTGVKIKKLRVSGGGSQSEIAMQMTADIFGLTVEKPHTFETSALGAAINCAVGLGLYPTFESAIEQMCHIEKTFEPNPANVEIYRRLYKKVYRKLYRRLKPLYNHIRHIIDYPKIEK
ncbi:MULTISPECIES: FGGY-family carbohydrate kinase [unclassified Lentimicrobium]|uniref:FGGY-family carbohydrate kinase n=1 Tax=unclassified Lentimicrobium TaxID=2677434 RepID=UPI0015574CB3|nr:MULTISPECIES: FGGY-family carbohydrate kinase [unclassified Lentimicrobium]NPD45068.1 carbohydrate kinase [Lentimicrobium sp. S6]NPD84534.1 carbohydrate kinase [Lentimicrobium sp. L6]